MPLDTGAYAQAARARNGATPCDPPYHPDMIELTPLDLPNLRRIEAVLQEFVL
ncbi:protein of unknown function [Methylococcus capsulatus]|jgi:hypothetical protein|uniref:Uncharacterized protein n=1 Tax=Methylococcus capsulatus TaxID=414 RepID=A0AA35UQ16_METCP|nr:hypothetical protein [Methylococcus capsulatus]CAI8801230.1 protein of unknown function [Methylococcus capsulatus]